MLRYSWEAQDAKTAARLLSLGVRQMEIHYHMAMSENTVAVKAHFVAAVLHLITKLKLFCKKNVIRLTYCRQELG